MPKMNTVIASPYEPWRASVPASALHDPASGRTYDFDAFRDERGKSRVQLLIGRSSKCDIQIDHRLVSNVHAILERDEDNRMRIQDRGSTNGTFIDGVFVAEPAILTIGVRVRLGDVHVYATDSNGLYPITAFTLAEFRRTARRVYGNNTLAGQRIGTSRASVRRSVQAVQGSKKGKAPR